MRPRLSYAADWLKTVAQTPDAYSFLTKFLLEIQCFSSLQENFAHYLCRQFLELV